MLLEHCALAQVIGFGYRHAFVPWQRTTHASLCGTVSFVGGVRDHNIISRQEGTCWWNMHEAEGH